MEEKFYIINGKQIPLKRVLSARSVVTSNKENINKLVEDLKIIPDIVVSRINQDNILIRGDVDDRKIQGHPDVLHTRSVFVDENNFELILTDYINIKFIKDVGYEGRRELCKKFNCIIVSDRGDTWRIRVLDSRSDAPLDIANELSNENGVIFAEPDALQKAYYCKVSPIDNRFIDQWHLHNTGQQGGTVGADVGALGAWGIAFYGFKMVRIAIIDTGIDIRHPDLKNNMDDGWNFDDNNSDPTNNLNAHGTACAGVAAACANGVGVVGIAPECRIVPIRAGHSGLPWSTWAETFNWAAERADVISCSWFLGANNIFDEAIKKAATEGRNGKGIPIFFGTANAGDPKVMHPGDLPETIAVGASTNQDMRANFSNYGDDIDFVAPGVGIVTTDNQGTSGFGTGDYIALSGTSFSAPLAAGIAALMISVNRNLTAEQVRKIMRETCVKIDPLNAQYDSKGWSKFVGYGRVNAADAVKSAKELFYLDSGPYVGSKRSNKTRYHRQTCEWAQKIRPENIVLFATLREAISHSYKPCKVCRPYKLPLEL